MTNYITLFQNKDPLTKNHPVQSGVIKINEPLPAGEYEFGLFENTSKKGVPYRSGTIRPAYKKEVKPFSEPKESDSINWGDETIPF